MSLRGTLLAAAIATAVATAYMVQRSYVAATSIDGVPVPARYLEATPPGDG